MRSATKTADKVVDILSKGESPKKGYEDAPKEAYEILNKLSNDQDKDLFFVANFNIKILLNVKESKKGGMVVLGKCKVTSDLERHLTGQDAIVILDRNFWYRHPERREPLLYHELCHLHLNDDGELKTVGHDVEEFYSVIKHYGDWNKDLGPIGEQLGLAV